MQIVVENAEQRVMLELDAFDVSAYRKIAQAGPESEPSIVAAEGQEMVRDSSTDRIAKAC